MTDDNCYLTIGEETMRASRACAPETEAGRLGKKEKKTTKKPVRFEGMHARPHTHESTRVGAATLMRSRETQACWYECMYMHAHCPCAPFTSTPHTNQFRLGRSQDARVQPFLSNVIFDILLHKIKNGLASAVSTTHGRVVC